MIRLMPNLPCVLQEGALLLACGTSVKQEVASVLKGLLSPCGMVEVGLESWIDAHTGLSGSGVAFVSTTILAFKKYATSGSETCNLVQFGVADFGILYRLFEFSNRMM